MKKRIGFVVLLVMLTGVVLVVPVAPVPVAHAEDNCEKVIPVGSLLDEADLATGASGALVAGVPGTVSATGAAPKVALTAGTVGKGAAAFVSGVLAGCTLLDGCGGPCDEAVSSFWDWVSGDGDAMGLEPLSDWYHEPLEYASSLETEGGWIYSADFNAAHSVFNFTLPDPLGASSWRVASNAYDPLYVNDVTISPSPANHLYPTPTHTFTPATYVWYSANYGATWGGSCALYAGSSSDTTGCASGATSANAARLMFTKASGSTGIVGGNGGLHPRTVVVVATASPHKSGNDADASYVSVLNPVAAEMGWSRVIHTDVQCMALSGTSSWVRASSGVYFDRQIGVRIPTPMCPDDTMPVRIRTQRVPTGIPCTLGTVCYNSGSVISDVEIDSSLAVTATAPDWVECLHAGNDCGKPALDGETCLWGGIAVPSDFCDTATWTGDPVLDPSTAAKPSQNVEPIPATAYEPGVLVDTSLLVDPSAPPTTTIPPGSVVVPIDGGEGEGGGTLEPDEDECWPDGWGWFNPAQWVLRPIKCALVWAFVPTDAAGWASDQWDALETQVPFSYGVVLVDFLDVLSDPTTAAAAELCFGAIPMPEYDDGTNTYDAEEDEDACLDIAAQKAAAQENDALLTLLSWCTVGYVIYRMMIGTLGSVFK